MSKAGIKMKKREQEGTSAPLELASEKLSRERNASEVCLRGHTSQQQARKCLLADVTDAALKKDSLWNRAKQLVSEEETTTWIATPMPRARDRN
jgi:hypothetical protein